MNNQVIGQVFNELTIIAVYEQKTQLYDTKFLCKCSCGNEKITTYRNLKFNKVKSCGCLIKNRPAHNFIDLTGKQFGRLFVLSFDHKEDRVLFWKCICKCGNIIVVRGLALKSGNTTSCGCYHKEVVRQIRFKHGLSNSSEYQTWRKMKNRCLNINDPYYQYYGGRGITICDRWLDNEFGFINFIEDMGMKPFPEATIERLNCNGNYERSNCVWSPRIDQNRNQTKTIFSMDLAQIVKDLYTTNQYTYEDLAIMFNCHKSTIGDIIRLKTWV